MRMERRVVTRCGERYQICFGKKIQLCPGTYKFFLGLSADDYFREVETTLKEGDSISLEFKPINKHKTRTTRIPDFEKGIKEFKVSLNNVCF